ncbi:hypothetical protein [Phytohabitans rumicis]|nr:hypothetical protein [Phytohabitans rumicis]
MLTTGCSADERVQDPWSEPAVRFGQAPRAHPDVTFQPDVVIVGGGGDAIRSVTADGLTWRIDGRAERADQLVPGKVMFVTNRGVGRVLHVESDGDDLLVTAGPVDLTEVIRDGTFERTGVTLTETPVIYPVGDAFWADPDRAATGPAGGTGGGTGTRAHAPAPGPDRPLRPPPTRGRSAEAKPGSFSAGVSLTDGANVSFYYSKDGTKVAGNLTLTFTAPSVDFSFSVRGGRVTRAEFEINGGFGIRAGIEAGIHGQQRDIVIERPIPFEFAFPLGQVLGVPLSLTIGQTIKVVTAFGTSLGTMKGTGEFSVAGGLGFGYANGSFGPRVTRNVARKKSLLNSITGLPVGVMGLLVEHRVRFNVGFNAHVLAAGVYFELRTAYGMTAGSTLGAVGTLGTPFVQCRGVGLGVWAHYGIGYTILKPVADAINAFIDLLNVGPIQIPHISTTGGIASRPWEVYTNEEVTPDVKLCGHTPGHAGA